MGPKTKTETVIFSIQDKNKTVINLQDQRADKSHNLSTYVAFIAPAVSSI